MTDANESQANLEAAIAAMTDSTSRSLYDVTIICTTDDYQAEYWMKRLSEGVCRAESGTDSKFPMVLAVSEDWGPGGAGNGLGTLYAFQKAAKLAKDQHDVDLDALLAEKKISAALFHTAGKGTRLAPLPASENNNKPGVKLPFCHEMSDGSFEPLTVLEAVVKQTGVYAPSRLGRLSVYWGDQVFIPNVAFKYTPTHHVDIMCTLLGDTAPTAEEWVEQGLDKYGVIAVLKGEKGDAAQVEKVSHATAVKMLETLGDIGRVGPSLGSFSVSAPMLNALCQEYAEELTSKTAKLDTDPHFWMPLTLPSKEYASLMAQKGIDEATSITHHERMTKMKEAFEFGDMGLFGAVDVGSQASWWDYGQLKLYSKNNLKFLEDDTDAKLLKKFLGIPTNQMNSTLGDAKVDDASCIFSCKMKSGTITNSVLGKVEAPEIEADGAIIVNCTAKKIKAGKGAILYNLVVAGDEGIVAEDGDVFVSVMDENGEALTLKSRMDICGGQAWKTKLDINPMSFEDVHKKNKDANITVIEEKRKTLYKKTSRGEFES
eukprot:CAMPEP_0195281232 /NCGR_PEP_ID=MMETSP0707-20130614/634_1 /TAXON_ID=33640 /ORGANISM="Asterionellopsis glacialis, Strain CCMP134" /LENGTH=543 /DNA_ID=CAMNT_0040340101 /DNA_START=76 /DNA_END=1707 /DNA_ORIENTATION=+